jgi:hypothetical protein
MNRLDRVPGRPTCQESPNPEAVQAVNWALDQKK